MRLPFRSLLFNYNYYPSFNNLSRSTIFIKNAPTQMKLFLSSTTITTQQNKHKIVVIMGPTGSGKTRLSIDLATRYFPSSEIINSDKIQLYKGLNITTNKIPLHQQLGVPHHLLGHIDSSLHAELTPSEFRALASDVISDIISRNKLPLLVGGSTSLIYGLLAEDIEPINSDVFSGSDPVCSELRYECCFLRIDVALPVLNEYLIKRVDEMVGSGMLDELREFYDSGMIDEVKPNTGIRKAIGVPEFERYFRGDTCKEEREWDWVRRGAYDEAVRSIKENTCELGKIQVEKIQRLGRGGWRLWRIDGTDTFRGLVKGSKSWKDVWERQVVEPSVKIVKCFLEE